MENFNKPIPLTQEEPWNTYDIMPKYDDIPEEFKDWNNKWAKWQAKWMFKGLVNFPEAKEGINTKAALRHLYLIQSSFDTKHEHKVASVAYLASLWLEDIEKKIK